MGTSFIVSVSITLCSLLFYLFVLFVYFHKNANYNIRNRIFRRYLFFGTFSFIFEMLYLLLIKYSSNLLLIGLSRKFLLLCLVACILLWIYYVFILIYENDKEKSSAIRRNYHNFDFYILVFIFTLCIIDCFIPVDFIKNDAGNILYLSGAGIFFNYILIGILLIIPIPFIIKNRELVTQRRLMAYYFNIVFTVIMIVMMIVLPKLNVELLLFTLCSYMIYYRLENPDLLYVRNYKKNQERMRTLREKYGFLFNMSPELRDLLNEVSLMKDNYLVDGKKNISRRKLETLINDFIKSSEGGVTTQTTMDDDGIEILELEEDTPDEMLVTKEIYSLDELKEVLKEDNIPKW